jgi:hypothetical protein
MYTCMYIQCTCTLCVQIMYVHVLGHHCGTNVSIAHLPVRTCTWKYSVRWRDLWTLKTWMNWLLRCPWSVTSLHTQQRMRTYTHDHKTMTHLHFCICLRIHFFDRFVCLYVYNCITCQRVIGISSQSKQINTALDMDKLPLSMEYRLLLT